MRTKKNRFRRLRAQASLARPISTSSAPPPSTEPLPSKSGTRSVEPRPGDDARETVGDAQSAEVDEFESEEERFFSEPPELYDDHTEPSFQHPAAVAANPKQLERAPLLADSIAPERFNLSSEKATQTPTLSARRRQLRRRVAGVLCAMLAFLVFAIVARKRAETRLEPGAASPLVALRRAAPPAIPSPATPISRPEPVAEVPPPAPTSSADETTSQPSVEETKTLIRKARALLNSGRTREGVALAREAVSRNPLDAEPYILLGAGLQDLGAWAEAHTVFAECLQKTPHGLNSTCQYFAHR